MGHLNIEIKARCANPQHVRELLRASNADFRGVDKQIDTYFRTPQGRLKLREGQIENSLVYYEREDQTGPKHSNVSLVALAPHSGIKEILMKVLEVLVSVEKQREIYFIGNVKFHIDSVKGLGSFVEIEAIDLDGSQGKEKLLRQCREFMELFCIVQEDLVTVSYSDLLLAQCQQGA